MIGMMYLQNAIAYDNKDLYLRVKEYLAKLRGEQTYYWMVVGYGASRPLASSAGDSGGKSNRRIEIFVND